jgi:hypothetical protein
VIQGQIDRLSLKTSMYQWPRNLHFPWLSWPSWTPLIWQDEPGTAEDIIKKWYLWPAPPLEIQEDPARLKEWSKNEETAWNKVDLPPVEAAISNNTLEMQTAHVDFPATNGARTAILRFRFRPLLDPILDRKSQLSSNPFTSSWSYLVIKTNINPSVAYTPITGGYSDLGEMAYLHGHVVIFETLTRKFSGMSDVFIKPLGDAHHAIGAGGPCFFKLP